MSNVDKSFSGQLMEKVAEKTILSAEFDLHAGTNADVGASIAIPAGVIVTDVFLVVTEAIAGGSPDINIGDEDTADLYADGLGALAVNQCIRLNLTEQTADYSGFYYTTANTIRATMVAKPTTTGIIKLIVKYIKA